MGSRLRKRRRRIVDKNIKIKDKKVAFAVINLYIKFEVFRVSYSKVRDGPKILKRGYYAQFSYPDHNLDQYENVTHCFGEQIHYVRKLL